MLRFTVENMKFVYRLSGASADLWCAFILMTRYGFIPSKIWYAFEYECLEWYADADGVVRDGNDREVDL